MPRRESVKRPWMNEPKPRAEVNQSRGGNEQTQFYRRKAWRDVRALVLRREPMCRECVKHKRLTPATMVDHIKPIKQGGAPYDLENLQPLCYKCHARKSAKDK